MDSGDKQRVAKFLEAIQRVSGWLDAEFDGEDLPPDTKELAATLQAYLQHCRRHVESGRDSVDSFDRNLRKIERSWILLWRMTRGPK